MQHNDQGKQVNTDRVMKVMPMECATNIIDQK